MNIKDSKSERKRLIKWMFTRYKKLECRKLESLFIHEFMDITFYLESMSETYRSLLADECAERIEDGEATEELFQEMATKRALLQFAVLSREFPTLKDEFLITEK